MADKDAFLSTALKRFKLAAEAEAEIRKLSLEDAKFRAGDQWPANIKQAREIDQRPCLTINRIPQFIKQITNDTRQNRPSLKISAVDDGDEDTAEILEGIVRHIQYQSDADIAYDTATDNQVTMGFGYFRVLTDYCDDMSFDQDIKIKRIKNAFTVYFDPNCQEPDYSDARWCFIVSDMPKDEFKSEYPDHMASDIELSSIGDNQPGWVTETDIRIAEYFVVEEKKKTIWLVTDGRQKKTIEALDGELPMGWMKLQERETVDRKVMWHKITAFAELEKREWAGKYIPVIPVLGEDLDIDGDRKLFGLVRGMQDPQRMYNFWSTAQTEAIALAPKAPFIMAEGQDEGYESYWDQANTKSYSRLVYKPIDMNGTLLPPPQRNQAEPPVQAMVQAIHQASDDMKATTGIYDASLGNRSNEQSGRAIMARQQEGDVANFNYTDNLSRAIKHLGRILLDLIPKVYDVARIMRILHEDGSSKMVKVNQPSGEKDTQGMEKIYDLTAGKYDVAVSVGPSYSTKRMENVATMTQIIQAYPPVMQLAGDIIVKQMDFPMAEDLSDRLKMGLPPEIQQQLKDEDGNAPLPPAVQSKMQQMTQMITQLSQQLHTALDQVDGKKAELDSKERIAYAKNETDLAIAVIGKETDNNMAFAQHELNRSEAMFNAHSGMVQAEHAQAIAPPEPQQQNMGTNNP